MGHWRPTWVSTDRQCCRRWFFFFSLFFVFCFEYKFIKNWILCCWFFSLRKWNACGSFSDFLPCSLSSLLFFWPPRDLVWALSGASNSQQMREKIGIVVLCIHQPWDSILGGWEVRWWVSVHIDAIWKSRESTLAGEDFACNAQWNYLTGLNYMVCLSILF
jgi:hypothetical protein